MRILVLDDDEERHGSFARRFAGNDVKHARTVKEAIDALESDERYDLVHLDHDLNDYRHEEGRHPYEVTGTDVAQFMATALATEKMPNRVVVHSWNMFGATRMVGILRDAGCWVKQEPFRADTVLRARESFEGRKG